MELINIFMKKLSCVLIIIFCLSLFGCSVPATRTSDPRTVVIRNSSNEYFIQVSIKEVKKSKKGYMGVGSISPLPIGASQVIGKSSYSPRLPSQIDFCLLAEVGNEFCHQIYLKQILNKAKGSDKAIVFDVLNHSQIKVFLE